MDRIVARFDTFVEHVRPQRVNSEAYQYCDESKRSLEAVIGAQIEAGLLTDEQRLKTSKEEKRKFQSLVVSDGDIQVLDGIQANEQEHSQNK